MTTRCLLIVAALILGACGSDDRALVPDTHSSAGGSAGSGGAADAGTGGTAAASPCEPDAPLIGGTAETDALADSAARCGQAEHGWIRGKELGTPVAVSEEQVFVAAVLSALITGEGVELPREPVYDVALRTVTYQTQDRGALIDASALVAAPKIDDAVEARDIIMLLHGTMGFTDGCGSTNDSGMQVLSALLASFGYVVVAPDYLGLRTDGETGFLHPYLAGQPTAIASLDAVRAAQRLSAEDRGGVCASRRFVTFGGSQGGHAALWVDRLAPYYARELDHAGTVATVPPSDLVGQSTRGLQQPVTSTANMISFFGAASEWYGLHGKLSEIFVAPWDVEVPKILGSECSPDVDIPPTLEEIFSPPLLAAAANETLKDYGHWGCMLEQNGLTTTGIRRLESSDSYGILFVTAENDELVHTPIEREAFGALCEAGQPLRYLECADASHTDASMWALPEILAFIDARLAGETFESDDGCALTPATTCQGTPSD